MSTKVNNEDSPTPIVSLQPLIHSAEGSTDNRRKMRQVLVFGVVFALFLFVQCMPDFCTIPKDEGTGKDTDIQIVLYYNATRDKCYPFRYTGVGGNGNRFGNERECMRNCSANTEETISCHFPKATGECYGNYLRFYYDPIHEKCKSFFYTGCVGNGNRYLDLFRCNATCAGIKDDGDTDEDLETDTPIALILGIVFGLVGAIILIFVVVLTLKSKKKSESATKKSKELQSEAPLKDEGIEMA
ncbi:BPTI/Kunitz domain-containing protein isoform X2 [Hypomesus transpacificus]|uniref:BPTI/Kunitz domain-containing protein isoform X2 n=1 Tax=Hypomesus transpacificus TaxID=137520 RepID=UPI001F0867A4|nr:BPTI/Kunitz domain-containing protein isoform X2 [Hypomesus transpacificus]